MCSWENFPKKNKKNSVLISVFRVIKWFSIKSNYVAPFHMYSSYWFHTIFFHLISYMRAFDDSREHWIFLFVLRIFFKVFFVLDNSPLSHLEIKADQERREIIIWYKCPRTSCRLLGFGQILLLIQIVCRLKEVILYCRLINARGVIWVYCDDHGAVLAGFYANF